MLKKILKYDLRAIYKYLWIGAVASLGFSILGSLGYTLNNMSFEKQIPDAVIIFADFAIMLSMLGKFAFFLLTEILIFARFYKSFYTDEGYLTFTLPVKRSSLLISKLITGLIVNVSTILVCVLDSIVSFVIENYKYIISDQFLKNVQLAFIDLFKTYTPKYCAIYAFEILALTILSVLVLVIAMYLCISIGSLIAKKAKIILSAIMFCCVCFIIVAAAFLYFTVVAETFYGWMWSLGASKTLLINALAGGTLIIFDLLLFTVLKLAHHRLLERKLNLQ